MKAFDTQMLDEECERIAREISSDMNSGWVCMGGAVKDALVSQEARKHFDIGLLKTIFRHTRRPKMVPA